MVKAKTSISYYIVVIMLMMVSIVINLTSGGMSSNEVDVTFTVLSQIVCMLLLPVILYFTVIKPKSKISDFTFDFGIKPFKKGEVIKVICLGLIAIYLNTVFAQANYGLVSLTGYTYISSPSHDYNANIWWLFADLILTAMFPAICEETAHRGLFRVKYGNSPAKYMLISSLCFALMHQNIAQVVYTFFTGLLFSSAVLFTGNLKAGMIMHFMVNATEVIADYGLQTNNLFLAGKQVMFSILQSSIVGKVFMIIIAFVLFYLYLRLLYSFKGGFRGFKLDKMKRMMVDGTLNVDNTLVENRCETKGEKVLEVTFMVAIILVGILTNVFTLTWGILR